MLPSQSSNAEVQPAANPNNEEQETAVSDSLCTLAFSWGIAVYVLQLHRSQAASWTEVLEKVACQKAQEEDRQSINGNGGHQFEQGAPRS